MIGQKTALKENILQYAIIIPVTHSIKCLRDCLNSLEKLDYQRDLFHVVLIDCHILPDLKVFFDDELRSYSCQISTITLPEQPDKQHISWLHDSHMNMARNAAMQKVPARYFVFTEDDCMFEPDWLSKFDAAFLDDTGAAGGPDVLPEGMGWFSVALDCILNSYFGTAGSKRGDGMNRDWYYPRQQNTVIPAKVLEQIGRFPEDMTLETELEMAKRICEAGWQIKFLPDNPVWHWRETTYLKFVRRNVYQTTEKVKLLRQRHAFNQSPHFLVLITAALGLIVGLFSLVNSSARSIFWVLCFLYLLLVFFVAISSLIRTRSLAAGLGVILLLPSHHFSVLMGVIRGVAAKITDLGNSR